MGFAVTFTRNATNTRLMIGGSVPTDPSSRLSQWLMRSKLWTLQSFAIRAGTLQALMNATHEWRARTVPGRIGK